MATTTLRTLHSRNAAATTRTRKSRSTGDTTARAISKLLDRKNDATASIGATQGTGVLLGTDEPPRLLMIIDDFAMRVAIREVAEQAGVVVDSSPNPEAALERFLHGSHALVATDSLSIIRAMRAMPPRLQPYLFYVVDKTPDDGAAGVIAGADDSICASSAPELLRSRIGAARRIAALQSALTAARAERETVASLDPLTRAGTRRFFEEQFPREIRSAARNRVPLSMAICDVDHFKRINDTHGHAAGDHVLRELSGRIINVLRDQQDWIARVGGEEFAIVFARTRPEDARGLARRMRLIICSTPFRYGEVELDVSASFGLVGLDRVQGSANRVADYLKHAADKALYKSKESGRNRVTVAMAAG
jgi:diguanylate cyclase (GGDEF)-like protein